VKHSNNPIIKDKLKNIWGTCAADRRQGLTLAHFKA
jgi:arginine/serine-rich splicing factor 12